MKLFHLLFLLVLISCSQLKTIHQDGLTLENAVIRGKSISHVEYDLVVDLTQGKEKYKGEVLTTFHYKNIGEHLRIDFLDGEILSVFLNNFEFKHYEYNKKFILIDKQFLKEGSNSVKIVFNQLYSKNGSGLYRFEDSEDNKTYLYTDFEPYDANRFFPCFDQPDLRANYKLKVLAPEDWQVITSVMEEKVIKSVKLKTWIFPRSQNFSTYIFSLHAGHYKVWKSNYGKIPLRLFARQSIAKYVDHKEWFDVTKQGLAFFNKYFGVQYPFKKYDQLIVPDFNAGAMENVAAVTFREGFVHRSSPTINERASRANVILHEMAHMWFGNLVTMRWWNGLWLNESFATYMAYMASANATEFKHAWQLFFADTKNWAYWEDQLVTTHPIEVPVPDTHSAFSNFDGITYGKGASVLKLLRFYIGPENFKKGIQNYFKEHAYQNTELKDFFGSMEKASGMNLNDWVDQWLNTAGLNTLKVHYTCEVGKINSFNLIQTAPADHPTLRAHKTLVGLYKMGQTLTPYKVVEANYEGSLTKVEPLIGENCPDFVFPNIDDHDYVKVSLDKKSLETIKNSIATVKDPLARTMYWQTLWDMVRDTELSVMDYYELVNKNIKYETDFKLFSSILQKVSSTRGGVLFYILNSKEDESKKRNFITNLEKFFYQNLINSNPGSDFQKKWLDGFIELTMTDWGLEKIEEILNGDIKLKNFIIDQDRRWAMLKQLSSFNWPGSTAKLEDELKKDNTETGAKNYLAGLAVKPELSNKKTWFEKVTVEKSDLTFAKVKVVMSNLFPAHQTKLQTQFKNHFYQNMSDFSQKRDHLFSSNFARYFSPVFCDEASNKEFDSYIQNNKQLSVSVLKRLKVNLQEDQRCLKISKLVKL